MLIGFSLSAFLTEIETLFYHFFWKYPEWYIYLYLLLLLISHKFSFGAFFFVNIKKKQNNKILSLNKF